MPISNSLHFALVIFFTVQGFHAQSQITHRKVFDTIPYIMNHHQNKLDQFGSEPMTKGGVLFLGNSITEGGDWKKLLNDPSAINRGIGGDITYGILNRLDEIIERKPEKLFLLIGINDIGMDIPNEVIADNTNKILTNLKAAIPQTKIYLQSILPLNPEYPGFPQHYDKQFRVLVTNQLLFEVAENQGVTFVNLYHKFLDSRQRLDASLTNDGLHLNEKGYDVWVRYLKEQGHL